MILSAPPTANLKPLGDQANAEIFLIPSTAGMMLL